MKMLDINTIIVRPSGVWNTRAPLYSFTREYRKARRSLQVSSLSLMNTLDDIEKSIDNGQSSARKFFNISKSRKLQIPWTRYSSSFPKTTNETDFAPTLKEARYDINESLYDLRLFFIVKLAADFEAFSQCWALNILLAKREANVELTNSEQKLQKRFSPIHINNFHSYPSWPQIEDSICGLKQELIKLPHLDNILGSDEQLTEPVDEKVTMSSVLRFWRDFRNSAMHNSSRVTTNFVKKHKKRFRAMLSGYAEHLPDLEPRQRLHLTSDIPIMAECTHNKVVKYLNDELIEVSGGRRGLPEYPIVRDGIHTEEHVSPGAMFFDGDHELSVKVNNDVVFRNKIALELSNELTRKSSGRQSTRR